MKKLLATLILLVLLAGCVTNTASLIVMGADAFYNLVYPEIKDKPVVEPDRDR